MTYRRKLIEVALPLEAINKASAREKSIRHGHPSTLHLWWARRPLAACRAVLFAQLVDDPSAWPDLFPTEAEQDAERQRLFDVIEDLVPWEASTDTKVLNRARLEIARSFARGRVADGNADDRDHGVLAVGVKAQTVREYLAEVVPPVHDPFAGGGSIPLEAQRLGLRAIATDLNPVAVLINKALIEIPPKFAGRAPVGPVPEGEKQPKLNRKWPGATGLAEDVRRYGAWMREQAWGRIGHLYPEVDLPQSEGGGKATVIAWLWARTVESPNPAFRGVHVPLVASFWLSKKKGRKTWVEPVFSDDRRSCRFEIRKGAKGPELKETVNRKGAICLASGEPIPFSYIREEAKAGRMKARLMAVVAEGNRRRVYLAPDKVSEDAALSAVPDWEPDTNLPDKALGFRVQQYGMVRHADLFTSRQTHALATFGDLIGEARLAATAAATAAGWTDDHLPLVADGIGPVAYGDAIATYLACMVDKLAEALSTLCTWSSAAKNELVVSTFRRQALPMTWDFAEGNPFASSSGSLVKANSYVVKAIRTVPATPPGSAHQADAASDRESISIGATDPPYYDNVPYADLSDFFYVWLRRALRTIHPDLFRTLLVPKADELVAEPARHGGRSGAEKFFEDGMSLALARMAERAANVAPVTIYYAFKQSETRAEGTSSTGWETFLQAALNAGFTIDGTWPISTERSGRTRSIGSNALASSVVLVCRRRPENASTITRGSFRRVLRSELPTALRTLEKGNIAPVDLAQAAIGPGMAIFSRHARVLEADDSPMNVRSALQLIYEVLDEIRGEEEAELDRETRFAVTWFESHGFDAGPYGEAEVLATARAVSVAGVAEAGVCCSSAGNVRLHTRDELPPAWDPASDNRLTVWEATQHMIKRLEEKGEPAAAELLNKLALVADDARLLAYRLYTVCERKGWAEEGRAYNGLVVAWPELERLAGTLAPATPSTSQESLF